MASRNRQTEIHPPPKLQGGVAVEAEFVHCYKYSVVHLQIIMCIRRHVTLVYSIYPPLFAFQPEHRLEVSCLLILLVWARVWGEHCFVYFGKPFMNVRVPCVNYFVCMWSYVVFCRKSAWYRHNRLTFSKLKQTICLLCTSELHV